MEYEACATCDGPILPCGGCPDCDCCDESNCLLWDEE